MEEIGEMGGTVEDVLDRNGKIRVKSVSCSVLAGYCRQQIGPTSSIGMFEHNHFALWENLLASILQLGEAQAKTKGRGILTIPGAKIYTLTTGCIQVWSWSMIILHHDTR